MGRSGFLLGCLLFLGMSVLCDALPGRAAVVEEEKKAAVSSAEELSPEDQEKKDMYLKEFLSETQGTAFTYKREGRFDPFTPFVTEAIVKAETELEEEEMTGLRRFEPGQLSLVAIILTNDDQPLAMVQDQAGKGYILERNMRIGRYGVVENITQNKVIIEEARYTRSQTNQVKTIEMILRKEGEKQL